MARVTVEDCIKRVPNRFELVLVAAQRAKDLGSGAQMTVEQDRDKNPVVALREIEEDKIDLSALENELISGMQKVEKDDAPVEEPESVTAADAADAAGMVASSDEIENDLLNNGFSEVVTEE